MNRPRRVLDSLDMMFFCSLHRTWKLRNCYGDDDYEEDDDFEDVQSEGSDDAFEIADDGLVASRSF